MYSQQTEGCQLASSIPYCDDSSCPANSSCFVEVNVTLKVIFQFLGKSDNMFMSSWVPFLLHKRRARLPTFEFRIKTINQKRSRVFDFNHSKTV